MERGYVKAAPLLSSFSPLAGLKPCLEKDPKKSRRSFLGPSNPGRRGPLDHVTKRSRQCPRSHFWNIHPSVSSRAPCNEWERKAATERPYLPWRSCLRNLLIKTSGARVNRKEHSTVSEKW